jgi:alpha-tubulin suppressor-like RCC1 family protein
VSRQPLLLPLALPWKAALAAVGLVLVAGCAPIVSPAPPASPCATGNGGCDANATCSASIGSTTATCACNPGFTGDGTTCTEGDACSANNGGCDQNATCTSVANAAQCACKAGFEGDGHTCNAINLCLVNNGGCGPADTADCQSTDGQVTCSCHDGYVSMGTTCLSKCALPNACSSNATCSLVSGQVTCACNDGYLKNSDGICVTDPCRIGNGGCGSVDIATCDSSTGAAVCTCKTGYALAGATCVDACTRNVCPANSTCRHAIDLSTVCTCDTGFTQLNGLCIPDPCATNNGNCGTLASGTCTSSEGNRVCVCNAGYRQSSDGTCLDPCAASNGGCGTHAQCLVNPTTSRTVCTCDDGYENSGTTCVIDPCAINNGNCGTPAVAVCTSSRGIPTCSCRSGYANAATGSCVDLCLVNNGGCGAHADCAHDPLSSVAQCTCATGYQLKNGVCVGDPCLTNNGGCGALSIATCTSAAGVASCACATGYAVNASNTCVDACTVSNGSCQANSTCSHASADNAVLCTCNSGYLPNGNTCYANACLTAANTCDTSSEDCAPKPGGLDCVCKANYARVGGVCVPLISSGGAGGNHLTCVTKYDGTLYCAGNGALGPLVSRSRTAVNSFVPVGALKWKMISAGARYTCGLDSASALRCWHQPASGSASPNPTLFASGQTWKEVSVSLTSDFGCAVRSDSTLWCWGTNTDGTLGTGGFTNSATPVQAGLSTNWVHVSTGERHTCATRSDGSLWCWGSNAHGELGTGFGDATTESIVNSDRDWDTVSAGADQTCAVKLDGSLYCWGCQGVGGACAPQAATPTRYGTDTWSLVSAGGAVATGTFVCGVRRDRTLWCWGDDAFGQLGNNVATTAYRTTTPSPSQVSTGGSQKWTGVRTGTTHTCGALDDGTLWCWGSNLNGEIGDVTDGITPQLDPVPVPGDHWARVVATTSSTACALKDDHSLWCWGDNPSTIGDGNQADQSLPETELSSSAWSAAATGNSTCAINNGDQSLSCWGPNTYGELGIGRAPGTGGTATPQVINADKDWTSLCAGQRHTCAIKSGGTLWCWGDDAAGQLGQPSSSTSPSLVNLDTDWSTLACGDLHTCAVKTNGTLWCWGSNSKGQIGTATSLGSFVTSPSQVGTGTNWSSVSAGSAFTCAIPTDHTLWCWGDNAVGELGHGASPAASSSPLQVGAGNSWTTVSASGTNACGLQTDQSLWCWGSNTGTGGTGMLGSGDTAAETTPISVSGGSWSSVAVGAGQTCATRSNGSLWCWGSDTMGQLGDGAATKPKPEKSL